MKIKLIIIAVVLIGIFTYIWKSNIADKERLQNAEISHQQKIQTEQQSEVKAKHDLQTKIEDQKKAQLAKDLENQKIKQVEQNEYDLFMRLMGKWVSQDNIAGSTARIAVSTPVTELRKISDELTVLNITGCLKDAKGKLLSAMDDELTMYLYFMRNDIAGNNKISTLKLNHLNKLSESIELSTGCKNKFGLINNS